MEYVFGEHRLDPGRRELCGASERIAIEPRVFDLLVYLVRNRDRVLSKDDLIANVWGGRIVSDSTLTSHIHAARKAVGDSGEAQRLIRTLPRKGFRFIGAVEEVEKHAAPRDNSAAVLEDPSRPTLAPGDNLCCGPGKPPIAVLAFCNWSDDPDQEYFTDGIAEDIITEFVALSVLVRHRPQLVLHLQGPCGRCEAGGVRAGCTLCSRRWRAQIRQPRPRHRAAR